MRQDPPPVCPCYFTVLHARPLPCPQAARRPPPPRGSHDSPRRTHSPARGRPSGAARKPMPTREPLHTCGSRGNLQTHPPGPGPPVSLNGRRAHRLDLGIRIHSPCLRDLSFPIPSLTPNRDSCGVFSDRCLEASNPARLALCASPSPEHTEQGPGRLYLRMSCPWAPRSLLEPSPRNKCLGSTQFLTMSCECLCCGS